MRAHGGGDTCAVPSDAALFDRSALTAPTSLWEGSSGMLGRTMQWRVVVAADTADNVADAWKAGFILAVC